MSRSWISGDVLRSFGVASVLAAAGCSGAETYELRQPIEMGPWTFEVERAQSRVESRSSGGQQRVVTLTLRLHNYTERHEQPFDDFMNDDASGRMIIFPNIELAHSDGASFYALIRPSSGGSLRSERWQARVNLIPDNVGILADTRELAEQYVDIALSDLTVVIENPEHRAGQPRRVAVPLR